MKPFKDQSYSQRVLEISLPHRCLPQDNRKYVGSVTKRTIISAWKSLWPETFVECDFEGFETVPVKPAVNEIVSLAKIMGLEVDNYIDELVEEHNLELATEGLTELRCVSQKKVVKESLSEEEEVGLFRDRRKDEVDSSSFTLHYTTCIPMFRAIWLLSGLNGWR
ncbi:hypothetical protein AVEN_231072-1 [Araneus ventricosus]|uniref:Uncharacterized protein n=1 Tax=Araneus ventricosus TaxID=182803 RepID=A0A4Y2A4A1_ARAVE|nr:hypothetical protein AVEN_231072-1 [Araneus ventricosus]